MFPTLDQAIQIARRHYPMLADLADAHGPDSEAARCLRELAEAKLELLALTTDQIDWLGATMAAMRR